MKNEPLAIAFLQKYFPSCVGDEDAMQTARMGLWKACRCYDPSKGTKLSTLAYIVMRNTLLKKFRHDRKPKKNGITFISLEARMDKVSELGGSEDFPSEYDFTEDMTLHLDIERMLSLVTEQERTVITGILLENRNRVEVAREIGISQGSVRKLLESGIQKIRENTPYDKYMDYGADIEFKEDE